MIRPLGDGHNDRLCPHYFLRKLVLLFAMSTLSIFVSNHRLGNIDLGSATEISVMHEPNKALCPIASKVRIELNTGQVLNMIGLQVMSGGVNVARGKSTSQSTTLRGDETMFGSANAVDNNNGTFCHTDPNAVGIAWFELDLRAEHSIESITILNKWCNNFKDQPGCLCRMSNASIKLMNGSGGNVETVNLGDTCGQLFVSSVSRCAQQSMPTLSPTNAKVSSDLEL